MDLSGIVTFAKENWTVIEQAPWVFALCTVLALAVGYGWRMSAEASANNAKNERLALAEARVTDYKEKLEGKSPDEAQAQIAKLRDEVAALASYGLSNEAQQRLKDTLAGVSGSINILKNSDASDADRLYRQVVSTFRSMGWTVRSHAILGISDAPDSGVTLAHWSATDHNLVAKVRQALEVAGLDANEVVNPDGWGTETNLTIVFSSRDPDWVPAARWS